MSEAIITRGAYMDLSGTELAGIVTASGVAFVGGLKGIGALARWMLSSRVSREEWVEERVRAAFADVEKRATEAARRAEELSRRVDSLESDKVKLLGVTQTLIIELHRLDPTSAVLPRAQRLLNGLLHDDAVIEP